MMSKKKALGRGLSALLEDTPSANEHSFTPTVTAGTIANIKVAEIEANPFQPRDHFEEEALKELSESIQQHGLIQPVTVRKVADNQFQLISGERRFRASKLAGLEEIPAYIRIANDNAMIEMALVENIQREDLDAIEIATSYKRLMDECNLTQEQMSEKVAKKRSTITNYLRLLKLPVEVQMGIREKQLSMGHARALLAIDSTEKMLEVYQQIIDESLSVRAVEAIAKQLTEEAKPKTAPKKSAINNSFSEQLGEIAQQITEVIGTQVDLKGTTNGKGKIVISFNDPNEFSKITNFLLQFKS